MSKKLIKVEDTKRVVFEDDSWQPAWGLADEFFKLRYNHLHKFEIEPPSCISAPLKVVIKQFLPLFAYFIDSSGEKDMVQ